jgi:hypothetical protein
VDLALAAALVGRRDDPDHVLGGRAGAQELEAAKAVIGIDEGLRGDRPDPRRHERHPGADRERAGRDRDADLAGGLVPGDDGPGHAYLPAA